MEYDPAAFDLLALDDIIESYDYETDPALQGAFREVENILWAMIENYGVGINDYGQQMASHLRRTSLDGMKFMTEALGFSEKAGRNFHAANLFQDLGKIHHDFNMMIWDLPHRPTPEERAEKRKHTLRGPEVFAAAMEHAPTDIRQHPHVQIVIPAIQLFHHERCDGTGPFGKKGNEMGLVIKTICIADAKDGDMIWRHHQDIRRTEKEALERMKNGEKYSGAFDDTLDAYIRYRSQPTD